MEQNLAACGDKYRQRREWNCSAQQTYLTQVEILSSTMMEQIQDVPPRLALAAVLVVILLSSAWTQLRRWNGSEPTLGSPHPRKKEVLAPALFVTPKPEPLPDFDLSNDPEKYRPFRHGPSHVTMGIRKLDWNDWIQLDSNYIRYHDLKASELAKDLPAHVQYVDNDVTNDACFELLEELTAYLTNRYPKIFQLTGDTLKNMITGETFHYPARELSFAPAHGLPSTRLTASRLIGNTTEALSTAALLVQDDLVLMVENDGQYPNPQPPARQLAANCSQTACITSMPEPSACPVSGAFTRSSERP